MTTSLRPASLTAFIGQADVVNQLRTAIDAARRGGWQLDHFLFAGPPGLGKTSLAQAVAAELGAKIHLTTGPAIEHRGQLAALLTTLDEGDVLFIDEIHRLPVAICEVLYTAMEDARIDLFAGKKAISVTLKRFTLLAATTEPQALPRPLLDRFGQVWQLRPYATADLATIVRRASDGLGVYLASEACMEVARRSRGTPRVALRLVRRLRDALQPGQALDAAATLDALGVDSLGLEDLDRAYLAAVANADGPIGVDAIATQIGQSRGTVEGTIEPHLVAAGLVKRTARGRVATAEGKAHAQWRKAA